VHLSHNYMRGLRSPDLGSLESQRVKGAVRQVVILRINHAPVGLHHGAHMTQRIGRCARIDGRRRRTHAHTDHISNCKSPSIGNLWHHKTPSSPRATAAEEAGVCPASAVPTSDSGVTRYASSSSLKPSVPNGRCGITIHRTSDVES
jgi:hypothetical protein